MGMFARAERKRVALKIAITGPSGSGKTFSALKLAAGMGKRIAMLDTENGSGSLYAGMGDYDTVEVHAPYTVAKYLQVIRAAEAEGYEVLIIDSLSHAWAGEGGLLDQKSAKDSRGGNQFTNWAEISKQQEALKAALLNSTLHLIVTMRSKQEYIQNEDERGKKTVQKVGLAPIQRDGMEYEFTTVFDVDMQHFAIASKDRTGLFDGMSQQITEQHGATLMEWLQSGKPLSVVSGGQQAEKQPGKQTFTDYLIAGCKAAFRENKIIPTPANIAQALNIDTADADTAYFNSDGKFIPNKLLQQDLFRVTFYAAHGQALTDTPESVDEALAALEAQFNEAAA